MDKDKEIAELEGVISALHAELTRLLTFKSTEKADWERQLEQQLGGHLIWWPDELPIPQFDGEKGNRKLRQYLTGEECE